MSEANDAKLETPDENIACDECGQFGAIKLAGRRLCHDCVALAGCGCAGRGGDEG